MTQITHASQLAHAQDPPNCLFEVTASQLNVDALVNVVLTSGDGAVVTFVGSVRDNNLGKQVSFLEYEAYSDMAVSEMRLIGCEMLQKWGLHGIAIRHRVGKLAVGEISVIIAAAAPHRAEAFGACSEALDLLKERVPIWKKEYYEGGEEWRGMGAG